MARFEIRELDCYRLDGDWIQNTSYLMGTLQTSANNEKRALTRYLKEKHGITFYKNKTLIDFDGDCYTIIDRKTKEPLVIAIPEY